MNFEDIKKLKDLGVRSCVLREHGEVCDVTFFSPIELGMAEDRKRLETLKVPGHKEEGDISSPEIRELEGRLAACTEPQERQKLIAQLEDSKSRAMMYAASE